MGKTVLKMDKKKAEKITSIIEETPWYQNRNCYLLTVEEYDAIDFYAIEIRVKGEQFFSYTDLQLLESIRNIFDITMYIAIERDGTGLFARFID